MFGKRKKSSVAFVIILITGFLFFNQFSANEDAEAINSKKALLFAQADITSSTPEVKSPSRFQVIVDGFTKSSKKVEEKKVEEVKVEEEKVEVQDPDPDPVPVQESKIDIPESKQEERIVAQTPIIEEKVVETINIPTYTPPPVVTPVEVNKVEAVKEEVTLEEPITDIASFKEIEQEQKITPAPVPVVSPKQSTKNLNILAIGVNSGLTDTIMVISINKDKKTITTISIPRDLWIPKYGDKINRVYRKHGFDAFKSSVENVVGLKIDKYMKIYFDGFEDVINHLGGIWIYNKTEILDTRYPSKDFKYETFKLAEGYHKLDGETALKFARTRHGDNDFLRTARQQEIINGVYNRIKDLNIEDINSVLYLVRDVIKYVDTDISIFEGLSYISDFKDYEIKTGNVLSTSTHLYSDRNYYGEYIALPRDPSLSTIHNYVKEITN